VDKSKAGYADELVKDAAEIARLGVRHP